jgi:UDP-N-acetylglucosamine--N-acetylmuramyl-(pentapeptide) pyrophosphoryl-undecaprenol N-acetylglucosamine transferase
MLDSARAAYAQRGLSARVDAFIEDMAGAYAWADLVLCRSGALTVAELEAAGVASVLVPFPHAVDDHQTANGRYLEQVGASILVPQSGLDEQKLASLLGPLLSDRQRLLAMANAARSLAMPEADRRVAEACMAAGAARRPNGGDLPVPERRA